MASKSVHLIIQKALSGNCLGKNEIVELLSINDSVGLEQLFAAARKVRYNIFFNKVFLYGFVYFSTWCRNNCNFCYFRNSNKITRYRKTADEILDIAIKLADSGVHLIDLTMGEDAMYHQEDFASVLALIEEIKIATKLPVMISPGVVSNNLIDKFSSLGTEWYALYQETHNRELFGKLRIKQDYQERMNAKQYAKEKGLLIEEGILTGVGETLDDIADSLLEMGRIGAQQIRVMTFVPQKGIPMEYNVAQPMELELKIIAVMRLMYPCVLIPASLDIEGIGGLKIRLDAGANVVTSIIPPLEGLAGVAQNSKNVDDGFRTVKQVKNILAFMHLEPASATDYVAYTKTLKALS